MLFPPAPYPTANRERLNAHCGAVRIQWMNDNASDGIERDVRLGEDVHRVFDNPRVV